MNEIPLIGSKEPLSSLPKLKAGELLPCARCGLQHRVSAKGIFLSYSCQGQEHLAGALGRRVVSILEQAASGPIHLNGRTVSMGHARQSEFSEIDREQAVRRILLGRSTPIDEAKKRHISVVSIESWLQDPKLRGDLKITEKSNWHPKRFPLEFKQRAVKRVEAGESPAKIAAEFLNVTPGMIRNWANGLDMDSEPQLDTAAPLPPQLKPAPQTDVAEPAPPAPPVRHPLRDEAVAAYRSGMPVVDIIKALDLTVSPDCIRDWDAEDRANKRELTETKAYKSGQSSRYTDAQKRDAVARWARGTSAIEIATELKCSPALINCWAKMLGVQRTAEVKATALSRGGGVGYPDSVRLEALQRYEKGEPATEVAASLGISANTVYSWAAAERGRKAAEEAAERRRQAEAAAQAAADRARREEREQARQAAPPPPAAAAPTPPTEPPPSPLKIKLVTIYACPHCEGAISLPPAAPGQLRVTRGECPHCSKPVEL